MKPHRGTIILVLGILSLIVCGPLLGVPAWIMGKGDLKEIDAGQMDPGGRDITKIGMILGMVSTALFVLSLLVVGVAMALGLLGAAAGVKTH